jgi:hypothetical protein
VLRLVMRSPVTRMMGARAIASRRRLPRLSQITLRRRVEGV